MWNLYKYRVKRLIMDKSMLFWILMFPIILGTLFWMAFSDITEKNEGIDRIDVAVVEEGTYKNSEAFHEFLDNASGKEGNLNVKSLPKEKAEKALENEEVEGIVYISDKISIEFKTNGLNQTILKSMIDSYIQNENVIMDILQKSPDKIEQVMNQVYSDMELNKEIAENADGNMDVYIQYYFALFAMTCLFGANYGLKNTEEVQLEQSEVAVRRSVSPTSKIVIVFTDFMAALTIQMMIFTIVFLYLNLFLRIDFGNEYGYLFLSGFLSSYVGIAYGYMIGVLLKMKNSVKESIISATTLAMSFLSGLMVGNMKNMIENTVPMINRINPAAVISDSFYAISVFHDMKMYLRCMITLVIIGTLFGIISVIGLRKSKV